MRLTSVYLTLLACVVVAIIYTATARFSPLSRDTVLPNFTAHTDRPATAPPEYLDEEGKFWTFNYERDSRNYGLSEAQCSSAFPFLYKEVDRAVNHRSRNKIRIEEVDTAWRGDGIVRAMIWENQVSTFDSLL